MTLVHSGQEAVVPTGQAARASTHSEIVKVAVRGLTKTERRIVADGYICDARMSTVRNLQRKGMFYHHITSPNGRCGPMELTALGVSARALISSRKKGWA